MKGIILAGGSGTRLHPLTLAVSKQALPVYDKPMIYYPLSTLMFSGIREILIISTPHDLPIFKKLLGDGTKFGCRFEYKVQEIPNGLAQAFIIGEEFIGTDSVCLVLGDNIFYMKRNILESCNSNIDGGIVFGYRVNDPERYGVVEFDNIKPSARGEYEITDINIEYLKRKKLSVQLLGRGSAWLDTGTVSSLMEASQFVQVLDNRQGLKVGCVEEQAYLNNYIENWLKTSDVILIN